MVNRSAVLVRPKQPFVDWLRSVEELDLPDITLGQLEATLYLMPDYEDPEDAERVLGRVCEDLFSRELAGSYTDETTWPRDRGLRVFRQWFDIEHFDVVEDVGRGPIVSDRPEG